MPSETVMVIFAVPVCPVTGVIITVRLLSLPPKTMLLIGTRTRLSELALTVRFDAAVSASPTVKAIGVTTMFELIVWAAMGEMVGAVLGGAG